MAKSDTDAAYDAIEAAHLAVKRIQFVNRERRDAGRAFSLVATKLDEARLWLDEAQGIISAPEQRP